MQLNNHISMGMQWMAMAAGSFAWPDFFGGFGFVLAAVLLALWWLKIKNFRSFFQDRSKILATALLVVPALTLVGIGIYFKAIYDPYPHDPSVTYYTGTTKLTPEQEAAKVPAIGELYMANHSKENGKLMIGKLTYQFPAASEKKVTVRSHNNDFEKTERLRAWLGDRLVLDTTIGEGKFIGNFSDDVSVIAETVLYAEQSTGDALSNALEFIQLDHAGIARFKEPNEIGASKIYGFDEYPPSSRRMKASDWADFEWDISTMTAEQLRARFEPKDDSDTEE